MATTAGARFHLKSLFQQIENETHRENIYYDEVVDGVRPPPNAQHLFRIVFFFSSFPSLRRRFEWRTFVDRRCVLFFLARPFFVSPFPPQ